MTIKIYSTPACQYCRKAKDFFTKKNLAYEEINVVQDKQTLDDFIAKTGQRSVPVIDVDGTLMLGYNEEEINKAISSNR